MLRLARWGVDLLIIFVGLLVTLHYFGVNPTGALAGLGVGGVAIALAAQKTLENVVGGVSLIFDQALHVGDVLKVGDTVGTVREIGLRSTRIRTLDRTLVSVPNGQIATMTLESLSARDKFWLHPVLGLRYDTTSQQMRALLDGIRNLLKECRHVEPGSIRVRFLRFGPSSLDVEIFAYVHAPNWSQFLEIQEELQLHIMECIESTGIGILRFLGRTYSSPPLSPPARPVRRRCSKHRLRRPQPLLTKQPSNPHEQMRRNCPAHDTRSVTFAGSQ